MFLRSQQLSQYHARLNKDKEGNSDLDMVFSEDHREYFDTFCKKALAAIGGIYLKVNKKDVIPYTYFSDGVKEAASITITDNLFVKNSQLSVYDSMIEDAIVNYVLTRWYEHLGVDSLKKYFELPVQGTIIYLTDNLYPFLRKLYIPDWGISIKWSDAICVQLGNFTMSIAWSTPICVQVNENPFSLASESAP